MLASSRYFRSIFYAGIFFISCVLNIVKGTEDILISGAGLARSRSAAAGITELQRRKEAGDAIAKKLFNNSLHTASFEEKVEIIDKYNKERKLKEELGLTDEHYEDSSNGVTGGSGFTPLKKRTEELQREREAKAEENRILQQQNQDLQQRLENERIAKENEQRAKEEAEARAKIVSPLRDQLNREKKKTYSLDKELQNANQKLRTLEQKVMDLEANLGQEAIGAIHENASSGGGNTSSTPIVTTGRLISRNPIEILQQAYLGMIDDIGNQGDSSIQDDAKAIRDILQEIELLFNETDEGKIENVKTRASQLSFKAFEIVQQYEDLQFAHFERKIKEATKLDILKKVVIDDIFYDVFMGKMSELEVRILNLDVLEQSLDLTKLTMNQMQGLVDLNIYAPAKLSVLRTFLTKNETTLMLKIEERDAAIREMYQPSLEEVKDEIDIMYAEYCKQKEQSKTIPRKYDFAYVAVPLQLMRSSLAFFLLAKTDFTDKKFNDIQILDQSLAYLTRSQTRAFFVYLYDVYTNFSKYKKMFEEITLSSPPPIQQQDVQNLIKIFRNRLKTYFMDYKIRSEPSDGEAAQQNTEKTAAEKPQFNPAFNDRRYFREFAESINSFTDGTCTINAIKRQLKPLFSEINDRLSGVTITGIEAVMQQETTERVKMLQKTKETIEKFTQLVTQQGGIDAISTTNIPQLKELIEEMKAAQKDINDKEFPAAKLRSASTDFIDGSKILESPTLATTHESTAARQVTPLITKVATPTKRPLPPGRANLLAGIQAKRKDTTDIDGNSTATAAPKLNLLAQIKARGGGGDNSVDTATAAPKGLFDAIKAQRKDTDIDGNSTTTNALPIPKPNLLGVLGATAAVDPKIEQEKQKLLTTIEELKQKLEEKRAHLSPDDFEEIQRKILSAEKMINDGKIRLVPMNIRGIKAELA